MNGNKSSMAIGFKPIKIGNEEYDTKLGVNDTRTYIKALQSFGLKLQFYAQEKDIDKVVEMTDSIVDYKQKFVEDALIKAGMDRNKAEEVIGANIKDVIGDGKIEIWLGFTTEAEQKKQEELKN